MTVNINYTRDIFAARVQVRNKKIPFLLIRVSADLLTNITLLNCVTNKDTVTVVWLPPLSE